MTEEAAPEQQAPEQEPKEEAPKKRTAQERIAQLYGEGKEKDERIEALSAELAELRAQLLRAQETPVASPAPAQEGYTAVSTSSSDDLDGRIERALQKVVGPQMAEFKQVRQMEALRAQQAQALQRAQSEFPDMGNPQSELFKTTAEILRRDPILARLPDGPMRAVLQARGILADVGAPVAPSQKYAAAQPAAVGTGPVSRSLSPMEELQQLESDYDSLMKEIQAADGDDVRTRILWSKRAALVDKMAKLKKAPV